MLMQLLNPFLRYGSNINRNRQIWQTYFQSTEIVYRGPEVVIGFNSQRIPTQLFSIPFVNPHLQFHKKTHLFYILRLPFYTGDYFWEKNTYAGQGIQKAEDTCMHSKSFQKYHCLDPSEYFCPVHSSPINNLPANLGSIIGWSVWSAFKTNMSRINWWKALARNYSQNKFYAFRGQKKARNSDKSSENDLFEQCTCWN